MVVFIADGAYTILKGTHGIFFDGVQTRNHEDIILIIFAIIDIPSPRRFVGARVDRGRFAGAESERGHRLG